MDNYFKLYRKMISLPGLTNHTRKGYSTYIRSYLNHLQNLLHKMPEEFSWQKIRDYIKCTKVECNNQIS